MKKFVVWLAPAFAFGMMLVLIVLGSAQQAQKTYVPPTPAEAMDLLEKPRQSRPITSGQEFFKDAKFVGSRACEANCHRVEYRKWKDSWHAKILRDINERDIVLGNFKDQVITFRDPGFKATPPTESVALPNPKAENVQVDVVTSQDKAKNKYFFTVRAQRGRSDSRRDQTYEVVLIVGGKWQQTYHVRHKDFGNVLFPAPQLTHP